MEKDPALFHIMAQVSNRLTDEEIQALATFLQGLHDRADDAAATTTPAAAPAAAPAPAPAPTPAAEPAPQQS